MAAEAEATREARAKVSCLLIDFHQLIQCSVETFFGLQPLSMSCERELKLKINNRFLTSVADSR